MYVFLIYKERNMSIVYQSTVASLVVQVLVSGVTAAGFALDTPSDLMVAFTFELISQLVEFTWYAVVVYRAGEILAWTRYLDWFISTPCMLISTAIFFQHRKQEPIGDVFLNTPWLYVSIAFDLVHAHVWVSRRVWKTIVDNGTVFRNLCSWEVLPALAVLMDDNDSTSIILFFVMYAVWALYGVTSDLAKRSEKRVVQCLGFDLKKCVRCVFVCVHTVVVITYV